MKINYDTKEPMINSIIWDKIQQHPKLKKKNKRTSTHDSRAAVVKNILDKNALAIFDKLPIIVEINEKLYWFRMSYMREVLDIKNNLSLTIMSNYSEYFKDYFDYSNFKSSAKRIFDNTYIRCIVIQCTEDTLQDVINAFDDF